MLVYWMKSDYLCLTAKYQNEQSDRRAYQYRKMVHKIL